MTVIVDVARAIVCARRMPIARALPLLTASLRPAPAVEREEPEREMALTRFPWWESAAFLYAPFLLLVVLCFAVTPDDTFITLRYAYHLLHGQGLVFNPGERVEGFSSPLGLLVTLPAVALSHGHALLLTKLTSLLFGLLGVREALHLIRSLGLASWARRLALLLLGVSTILAVSAVNGLETSLAFWLTTAVVVRLVSGQAVTRRLLTMVFSIGLVWTRPEGLLLVVGFAAVGWYVERTVPWWRGLSWLLAPVLAFALLLGARLLYFHDLLPNTYYAKLVTVGYGLAHGFAFLVKAQRSPWLPLSPIELVGVGIQALLVAVGMFDAARRRTRHLYLVAAVVVQLLFILRVGGDWMAGGRFLAPVFPCVVGLEALGLTRVVRRVVDARPGWATLHPIAGAVAIAVGCALVPLGYQLYQSSRWDTELAPVWTLSGLDNYTLVRDGHYDWYSIAWADSPRLVRCVPSGDLVAYAETGYFSFARLDLRVLDPRGLSDRDFAKAFPSSEKTHAGTVFARWFDPSSRAGQIILRRRPVMILDAENQPRPSGLNGEYVRQSQLALSSRLFKHPVTSYRRKDFTCSAGA